MCHFLPWNRVSICSFKTIFNLPMLFKSRQGVLKALYRWWGYRRSVVMLISLASDGQKRVWLGVYLFSKLAQGCDRRSQPADPNLCEFCLHDQKGAEQPKGQQAAQQEREQQEKNRQAAGARDHALLRVARDREGAHSGWRAKKGSERERERERGMGKTWDRFSWPCLVVKSY